MRHRLVLDTDIGSDVDDALALAFALRHPDIDLAAVTTVSGDARKRGQIAAKLLRLAGREDIEVAAGLGDPEGEGARSGWMGHEGEGLLEPKEELPISDRTALDVLLDQARSSEGCEVATIGMQSNVAAALQRDPGFAERLDRLVVMGGLFSLIRSGDRVIGPEGDHNLRVDPHASVRVLNSGVRVLYVPLDVTMQTYLTSQQVDMLSRGDPLCRALARLVDVWAPILHRFTEGRMPPDHVAVMHDPLTIAAVVGGDFVTSEEVPVRAVIDEGEVRTFVDPVAGAPAEVVRSVDERDFGKLWLDTVLNG